MEFEKWKENCRWTIHHNYEITGEESAEDTYKLFFRSTDNELKIEYSNLLYQMAYKKLADSEWELFTVYIENKNTTHIYIKNRKSKVKLAAKTEVRDRVDGETLVIKMNPRYTPRREEHFQKMSDMFNVLLKYEKEYGINRLKLLTEMIKIEVKTS